MEIPGGGTEGYHVLRVSFNFLHYAVSLASSQRRCFSGCTEKSKAGDKCCGLRVKNAVLSCSQVV